METPPVDSPPRRSGSRLLDLIERAGNALPDPVSLFLILIGIVMAASAVAAAAGVAVTHPGTGESIAAINLFSGEQVQRLLVEMPQTFAAFPPLGLVLVVMLGIGIADKTGLIAVALRRFMASVPRGLLTASLIFAGVMSSMAVDAGYVVVVPLGAVLFMAAGRHPLAGLAAAFAGVSGGFSANLFLTSLDPLLAGFTTPAAQLLDAAYVVEATANYYFMIALVPVYVLLGTLVTEKLVEPRLGVYAGTGAADDDANRPLTDLERRGLRIAGIVTLVTLALLSLLVVPDGAPLRGENGDLTPFYRAIVALMTIAFLLPGLAYGIATKQIRSDRDAVKMASDSMADLGIYIVLAFVTAHFIALFNWSNLGAITSISGAGALRSAGIEGLPLMVGFVFVTAFLNLFVGSASAKWAIMAPIFVPMLMLLGYSPEATQAAYRIGDSATNIITPLMPYFPLVIVFAQKYDRESGIGTLISMMLPFSVAFLVGSLLLLLVWLGVGLPLGPDVSALYEIGLSPGPAEGLAPPNAPAPTAPAPAR
ncbi:MAG: AbgT family transporter [Rubricoccaceae bacterium]